MKQRDAERSGQGPGKGGFSRSRHPMEENPGGGVRTEGAVEFRAVKNGEEGVAEGDFGLGHAAEGFESEGRGGEGGRTEAGGG